MADGALILTHPKAQAWPQLRQTQAPRSSLWAVCACGREGRIDPKPWIGQGLARAPLPVLELRLRCACGARRARLEIRGLAEAPAGDGGLYVFR